MSVDTAVLTPDVLRKRVAEIIDRAAEKQAITKKSDGEVFLEIAHELYAAGWFAAGGLMGLDA